MSQSNPTTQAPSSPTINANINNTQMFGAGGGGGSSSSGGGINIMGASPGSGMGSCIRGRLPSVDMSILYEDASLLGSTFDSYEGFGSFFNEDVEVLIAKPKESYSPPQGLPAFATLDFYLTQIQCGVGNMDEGPSCPLSNGTGAVPGGRRVSMDGGNVNGGGLIGLVKPSSHFAEEGSQPATPQVDLSSSAGGGYVSAFPKNPSCQSSSLTSIENICMRRCKYLDKKDTFTNSPCDPMWIREMRQMRCIPAFGAEFKSVFFSLGTEFTFINHGAFGGALKIGTDIKRRYEDLAECQILKYMDRLALPNIVHSTRAVADRILRCDPKDVVLTQNATYALNVAIASLLKAPPLPRASAALLSNILSSSNNTNNDDGDGHDQQLSAVLPQMSHFETVVTYLDTEYLSVYKMILERLDLMRSEEVRTRQAVDELLFLAKKNVPPHQPGDTSDSGIKLFEIPMSKFFRRASLMEDDAALTRHLLHSIPRNTTVLVLDHVTSNSAIRLPVFSHIIPELRRRSGYTKYSFDEVLRSQFISGCETEKVDGDEEPLYYPRLEHIVIDGAHSPLQCHYDMDMGAMPAISQPSVYCGNFHKWFAAPKSAGYLWVRKDVQAVIRPLIVSHGAGSGFLSDFIWDGTKDLGAVFCLPALIEFWHDVVGIDRVHTYCSTLRKDAVKMLTTAFGSTEVPRNAGFMSLVELPPFFSKLSAKITPKFLQETLHATYKIEAPVKNIEGILYLRCSFFVNNDMRDYERLRDAILDIQNTIQSTMAKNFQEKYTKMGMDPCAAAASLMSSKSPGVGGGGNALPARVGSSGTLCCDELDAESHTGSKRGRSESLDHGDCSSPELEEEDNMQSTPPSHQPGGDAVFGASTPNFHDNTANSETSNPRRTKWRTEAGRKTTHNRTQSHKQKPHQQHHLGGVPCNGGFNKRGGGGTMTRQCPSHLPLYSNCALPIPKEAYRAQSVTMPKLPTTGGLYMPAPPGGTTEPHAMQDVRSAWGREFGDATAQKRQSESHTGEGMTPSISENLAVNGGGAGSGGDRSSESPGAAGTTPQSASAETGGDPSATVKPNCNGCAVNTLGNATRKTRKF